MLNPNLFPARNFLSGDKEHVILSPADSCCLYSSLIGSCSIDVQKRICLEHTSRVSCLTKETISSCLLWKEPDATEHLFHCPAGQNTARRIDSGCWNCYTLIFMVSVAAFCSLVGNYLPVNWTPEVPAFCFCHCFIQYCNWITEERRCEIPD